MRRFVWGRGFRGMDIAIEKCVAFVVACHGRLATRGHGQAIADTSFAALPARSPDCATTLLLTYGSRGPRPLRVAAKHRGLLF